MELTNTKIFDIEITETRGYRARNIETDEIVSIKTSKDLDICECYTIFEIEKQWSFKDQKYFGKLFHINDTSNVHAMKLTYDLMGMWYKNH